MKKLGYALDGREQSDTSLQMLMSAGDNSEQRRKLREALLEVMDMELTQRQREALCLYYIEGLRLHEIAARWGISKSAVSRHVSKAKKRVQQVLGYRRQR